MIPEITAVCFQPQDTYRGKMVKDSISNMHQYKNCLLSGAIYNKNEIGDQKHKP